MTALDPLFLDDAVRLIGEPARPGLEAAALRYLQARALPAMGWAAVDKECERFGRLRQRVGAAAPMQNSAAKTDRTPADFPPFLEGATDRTDETPVLSVLSVASPTYLQNRRLSDDGLPTTPCDTCGDGSFWAPADLPPELAAWRCDRCEPRPAELIAHSIGVPTGEALAPPVKPWTCSALADLPPLPGQRAASAGNPKRGRNTMFDERRGSSSRDDGPAPWDDGQTWGLRATKAGSIAARGEVARAWCLAAGGRVLVEGERTVLAVPVPRHEVICLDMQRVAGEAGMAMRLDVLVGENT